MINIEEFRIKDGWKANFLNTAVQPMVDGHMVDCAIMEEGPCTCGTQEELKALALEDAGLTAEDYE